MVLTVCLACLRSDEERKESRTFLCYRNDHVLISQYLAYSQVAMAKVMEQGPVLVLTFMVQQIMILRDAVGNIVEGGEVSKRVTI